ncbi:hypothetical protein V7157_08190 [Neobacillus drentensis]
MSVRAGAIVGFKYFDIKEVSEISVKVRGTGKGELQVSTTTSGEEVARIPISPEKDWLMYTAPMKINDGVNALYFYQGDGAIDLYSFTLE